MAAAVRLPARRYQDPLARVWVACAERVGLNVRRTTAAYASSDGRGTLWIADDSLFDADDSLAQMIFHELCHALVEGEAGLASPDWGLGQAMGANPWREHACLRLQAYLASAFGLRGLLAPTTEFRIRFWDSLPADPFAADQAAGGRGERSCVAGRIGAWRSTLPRWQPVREALAATAAIAALTPGRLRHDGGEGALPSLWQDVRPPPPTHPAGHAPVAGHFPGHGCADCAWCFTDAGNRHCRHAPRTALPAAAPACARFEPAAELDCARCGACCREAYQAVEVADDEAVSRHHPELIATDDAGRRKLRRAGQRCAALTGSGGADAGYACAIYRHRPQSCRDFERGGGHCLDARRRLGLSL